MDDEDQRFDFMSQRIDEMAKSIKVLNDHSHTQEIEITKINTKLDTTVSIIKWFISPVALVSLIIQVLRIWNVF